jgi:hypothetical protein
MKFSRLKYLLVFICIFSIMESTGISVVSLITHKYITQADSQAANDDEGTAERNNTRETNIKELWIAAFDLKIPSIYINSINIIYPHEQHNAHLAWVPPVPTPPPNSIV